MNYLKKQKGTSSILHQALCITSNPLVNSNWSNSPETLNSGQNWWFFCPVWPWNLMAELEKQKGTFSVPCHALCIISKPSMNSNWSYSPETLNSGQNRPFFVPSGLEIWRMAFKTIGHLFFAASSFVHYFVAIGEFKPELQPGNGQFRSKSIF